ncbi:MAG TPA: hypothetical protein VMS43_14480 [Allosphingosinicella sp.]|nr:hypothetical protein [Allosphingosinicella sp.]
MIRLALAPLALLGACQNQPAPANNTAAPRVRAPAPAPADDRAIGEQAVRRRLGNPQGLAFSNTRVLVTDRVPIVCGDIERGGRRERYIVVAGEAVFIESRMRAGEMDRAVREQCGDGERG